MLSPTKRGLMVIGKELPSFITDFFEKIDERIRAQSPGNGLSKTQKYWLAFCVLATLSTNSICWAKFEKVSLGKYKKKALSWVVPTKQCRFTNIPLLRYVTSCNHDYATKRRVF